MPKPSQIVPPEMRGRLKRARAAESGYRVVSRDAYLRDTKVGRSFSTPDLAYAHARLVARALLQPVLVLRDGSQWQVVGADGSMAAT